MEKPNFIEVYNNVLEPKWCDDTIELFEEFSQKGLTFSRTKFDKTISHIKDDEMLFCSSLNFEHIAIDYYDYFTHNFKTKALDPYIEKYSILNNFDLGFYEIKMQKTLPGQGYHTWHCEEGDRTINNRKLAWTAYLNDNFEAGETEFLYQQYRYKPKKGDVVIWPTAFTHVHRGNPPIDGIKYILTGWIEV